MDLWLTTQRTFCPVCKRDARTSTGELPASESTPLLSPSPSLFSMASSYAQSLGPSSSAIRISPSPTPSRAHTASVSSTYLINHQSFQSYRQSPRMSVSISTNDPRNASSQRSRGSYLISPHSSVYPSISTLNSQYLSPYGQSPDNGSTSFVGSSRQNHRPLQYSESATSFSPFASSHSLPEC